MNLIAASAYQISAIGLFFIFFQAAALANGPPDAPLAGAHLSGSGTLRFLGLEVYRAQLWVRPGFNPADYARQPLALELHYARSFSAEAIARRSLDEIQRQQALSEAQVERWQLQLAKALPDVAAGDRIVGIYQPGHGARFLHNGRESGRVDDAEFARLFFGIWLSPQSSEPALRAALLAKP
ncbi:MAG: chalcone isomerase family protein [Giesbergeria sp.]